MALHEFLYIIICELPGHFGRVSEDICCRLLHGLESIVVIHLEWMSSKAKEPSPHYYLTHYWEKWIHAFLQGISTKANIIDSAGI